MANDTRTKKCPRCHEMKHFARNRHAPDGLQYYCRDCNRDLRYEAQERDLHNPLAEEEKYQKQLRKLYR